MLSCLSASVFIETLASPWDALAGKDSVAKLSLD